MTNVNTSKQSNQGKQSTSNKPQPPRKAMKQLVGAVEFGEGENKRTRWTRIGTAFENQDGSWNLLFDFVPTQQGRTTIQLRDIDSQED